MYTSNSFFFFENVNNEGYISMSIAILFINEKKICENLATTYSFWRQENIWYSQWNKGNVTTLLHIEEKVLVVFSTSRSIAFIPHLGMSHGSFKEHPWWVTLHAFGEKQNHVHKYLFRRAEDLRSHIWMNFSWFIETLIMSNISGTLSCLSKNSLMFCLVST